MFIWISLNFYHCKCFIGTQTTRISWSAHRIKCVTIALHISKMKIVFRKHLIEGSECKIGRQYQVVLLFVGLRVCMCVCIWNAPWNLTTTATKMLSNITKMLSNRKPTRIVQNGLANRKHSKCVIETRV